MRRGRVKLAVLWVLVVIIIFSVASFVIMDSLLRPALIEISSAMVRYLASNAMQNSVLYVLGDDITSDYFIDYEVNTNGELVAMRTDTMKMNVLAAKTAVYTQGELTRLSQDTIDIAFGTLIGSQIFAGMGPKIHVKLASIGDVNSNFTSEFTEAGINQTRHSVSLVLSVRVAIISPLGSDSITVENTLPISETILMGKVPSSYWNGGFGTVFPYTDNTAAPEQEQ